MPSAVRREVGTVLVGDLLSDTLKIWFFEHVEKLSGLPVIFRSAKGVFKGMRQTSGVTLQNGLPRCGGSCSSPPTQFGSEEEHGFSHVRRSAAKLRVTRDRGLFDGPRDAWVAALMMSAWCLWVEIRSLGRIKPGCSVAVLGCDGFYLRLSARRKTYSNETSGGHHLCR